jgi:magnesium chelatase subunit I
VETEQASLRRQISAARTLISAVVIDKDVLSLVGELCVRLNVDGHRGELTIMRAARALAAFEGRRRVVPTDLRRVAGMSLRHRLRKGALGETDAGTRIDQALGNVLRDSEN